MLLYIWNYITIFEIQGQLLKIVEINVLVRGEKINLTKCMIKTRKGRERGKDSKQSHMQEKEDSYIWIHKAHVNSTILVNT